MAAGEVNGEAIRSVTSPSTRARVTHHEWPRASARERERVNAYMIFPPLLIYVGLNPA